MSKIAGRFMEEIELETREGREKAAIDSIKRELRSGLNVLAHQKRLNDFNAHAFVVKLLTDNVGIFTSDPYKMTDHACKAAWLADLLRHTEVDFIVYCGPK